MAETSKPENEAKKQQRTNQIGLEKNEFSQSMAKFSVPFLSRFKYELSTPSLYLLVFAFIAGILLCEGNVKSAISILILTFYALSKSLKQTRERNIEFCLQEICAKTEKTREFLRRVNAPQADHMLKEKNERSDWINDIVHRIWPFYNATIQREIDKQGYMDVNKQGMDIGGGHIIHFERFTLGDKPPVITHIGVNHSTTRSDELVLELKVLYFGNCLLSFTKKTLKFFRIKAGVKDIYFRGNARLVMRPLLIEAPYFGGFSFCLLDRPIIGYDGINLGNLADNRLFRNFLISMIESLMVLPNKIFVSLSEEPEIKRQLICAVPTAICYFEIIEAENLPRLDSERFFSLTGLVDPFCIIRVGGHRFETPVVYNSINPYWGEHHAAPVHDFYEIFKIDIYDKDALSADDFIGSVEFQLKDITSEKHLNGLDKWLPVGQASTGAIHFRVACFNLCQKRDMLAKTTNLIDKSKHKFPTGLLTVYTYNLRLMSPNEKIFVPVIQFKCGGQSIQTAPLAADKRGMKTLFYPVEQVHHFLLHNLEQDVLEITVVDSSGINFSKLTRIDILWDEIIGSCGIHIDAILRAENGSMILQKTFDLFKSKHARDSPGSIKLYLHLQIVEVDPTVYENLQVPTDVRCRVDQPTSETSFIRRVLMQPRMSIRHPIKTLKTLRNATNPFLMQKPIPVVDDLSPAPPNIGNTCHIKIRFKWPERNYLYIEILKVVNIPSIYGDMKYKFSVIVKIGQESTRYQNVAKASFRKYIASKQTHRYSYPSADKQKEPGSVIFNERLAFKIDASQNIDNYEMHILLKAFSTHPACICWTESNYVASALVKVPFVSFRSDPIERWFKLAGIDVKSDELVSTDKKSSSAQSGK
ncbi:extended synaptotagmin-2-like protein [Dinothrombium tinctorium]|uniref:Extended synaptotagmin-2-like protein n=1 Tax=Dinothrombium tinctorium TaxID=1965070 RepID=A0A3S3Q208_9ACAR|nr:extended synaptotagmin-2-like protein [Dinothrombium tinctorium]RWS12376.1 extended synaptotagmin-2-like protein [Dinothrombium tinctorium]